MILFLCYVFPPAAVLFMKRPFSAVLNLILTSFGWVPGIRHALVLYADYKVNNVTKQVTRAIHRPEWTQPGQAPAPRAKRERVAPVYVDSPHVGMNGTKFRAKN